MSAVSQEARATVYLTVAEVLRSPTRLRRR